MPTLSGPCVDCGTHVEKYVRRGKVLRCLDCGIAEMERVCTAQGTPGTPEHERAQKAGRAAGAQIRQGAGPVYERWVEGMRAYVETLKDTG